MGVILKVMKERNQVYTWCIIIASSILSACTANKKPSRVETALANIAKDVAIPIEAERLKNPLHSDDPVVKQGQQIYSQSCALCHGADGHGRTQLGQGMYPPAMDLTSPHVQHWNDAELFWVIQNGVRLTGMPAWKSALSETDAWKLVGFIHALPTVDARTTAEVATTESRAEAPNTPQELIEYGQTLYRQEGCFMCHRLNGEGGQAGPDLTVEGNRGRTDPWLIGHFKDPATFTTGSIMPAFKNLTDEQLKALTAFLQSQKGQKKTSSN